MNFIIISDIHSNLEAYETVISSFPSEYEKIICAGDIVGYGADPSKCINLSKELGLESVLGNHDAAVIEKTDLLLFNDYAKVSVCWTKETLENHELQYLQNLPLRRDHDMFTVVHGTLHDPEKYIYMSNMSEAGRTFDIMEAKICFVGHSHRPCAFKFINGSIFEVSGDSISIEDDARYIINVGSVGQPRDGDNRACYCVYDDEKSLLKFIRVEYDVRTARKKIIDAGLPEKLGDRLMYGL